MKSIELYPHQLDALDKMKNGCILCGDVGSGKSRTSLAYYFTKILRGDLRTGTKLDVDRPLYIITTARKRDSKEWENEADIFGLSPIIDSWNNIKKYTKVYGAFFIFDEQRVVGSGAWVKAFLDISRKNKWILLSATPGDTWIDYIPVFVANGFYKHKTDFMNRHAIYNRYSKWPKVDRFVETTHLEKLRSDILVNMDDNRHTVRHYITIPVEHDRLKLRSVMRDRWNFYKDRPIENSSEYFMLMRRVVNSDISRIQAIIELLEKHDKLIIFYNFDYELELLKTIKGSISEDYEIAEWNGHKHEPIPDSDYWLYFAQYTSSAEGWNCIETNAVVFYSQHYSYRIMHQSSGRIDRLNTKFTDLYYYTLKSKAWIDIAIARAISSKRNFNESRYDPFKKKG